MISGRKRNKVMHALCDIYYENYVEKINLDRVSKITNYSFDEVVKICTFLETNGLIFCDFEKTLKEYEYKNGIATVRYSKPKSPVFVIIKDSGISYFETKFDNVIDFFMKSILTPIIVSILTTLAIEWLPYLLELIQKWGK